MTEAEFIEKWKDSEQGCWTESACMLFWARAYGLTGLVLFNLAMDYMDVDIPHRAHCSEDKAKEILSGR